MSPDGRYLVAVSYDSKALFVRDNLSETWTRLTGMEFIEEPAWSADSSWIQFLGHPVSTRKALFRIRPAGGHSEETADLTGLENLGETWVGVAPDGSPLVFRGSTSYEVYALDWERR
jgi:Tol biopolymer transport system component